MGLNSWFFNCRHPLDYAAFEWPPLVRLGTRLVAFGWTHGVPSDSLPERPNWRSSATSITYFKALVSLSEFFRLVLCWTIDSCPVEEPHVAILRLELRERPSLYPFIAVTTKLSYPRNRANDVVPGPIRLNERPFGHARARFPESLWVFPRTRTPQQLRTSRRKHRCAQNFSAGGTP
jgi:hypothetical protein